MLIHGELVLELRAFATGAVVVLAFDAATGADRWQLALGRAAVRASSIAGDLEIQVSLHALDDHTIAIAIVRDSATCVARVRIDGTLAGEDRLEPMNLAGPLWLHTDGRGDYAAAFSGLPSGNIVEVHATDGSLRWLGRDDHVVAAGEGMFVTRTNRRIVGTRAGQVCWTIDDTSGLSVDATAGPTLIAGSTLFIEGTSWWNEWAENDEDHSPPPPIEVVAYSLADGTQRWEHWFRDRQPPTGWIVSRELACIAYDGLLERIDAETGALQDALELAGERIALHALADRDLVWSTPMEISCTGLTRGARRWSIPPPGVGGFRVQLAGERLLCLHEHSMHVFGPRTT